MVLPEQDGMRLRDVLRRVMGVSYTAMKSAKWNGGITVDGVVTPVDAFVRAGQVVAIRFRENAPVYAVKPYDLPLTIAHEDDWLFVIDKPAPLAPVQRPAPGRHAGKRAVRPFALSGGFRLPSGESAG